MEILVKLLLLLPIIVFLMMQLLVLYFIIKLFANIIVSKLRNHYETIGNIDVVSTDSFKQLDVANQVDYVTN